MPAWQKRRAANAAYLSKELGKIPGLIVPDVAANKKHAWHQYTVRVTPRYKISRERLINKLTAKNIGSGLYYSVPIHRQPAYRKLGYKARLPVAEKLAKEVLSLPVHPGLSRKQLDYLIAQF